MERRYLTSITPLSYQILQVDFISGACLPLNMKPYPDKLRFLSPAEPKVLNSAVANGIFVHFGNVKLSHDELLSVAERKH